MRQDFNQWVSPFLPTLYTISGKIGKLPQWVDREDVVSQMLFDLWGKWKRGELQNKPTSYMVCCPKLSTDIKRQNSRSEPR